MESFDLHLTVHFAAAHNLREYPGNCERLHGHNWVVDVVLQSEQLNELGMVMDFREVKAVLRNILNDLDHHYLNDIDIFKTVNPTTENIAKYIYGRLKASVRPPVSVRRVTAWESEGCGASYYEV